MDRPVDSTDELRVVPSLGTQIALLGRRSVVRALRQPAVVIPIVGFPLFFLALNAAALKTVTHLPGFPTDSYLAFSLASTFALAAVTTVSVAGGALADDIRSGFLSRLTLTPLRGAALVFSHLAASAVLAAGAAILYIVIAVAAGAPLKTGVGGAVALVAIAVLLAVAFSSLGVFAALGTGNPAAVQALFPLLLVLLFLSSQALPRNLIAQRWFRDVATYNPMSYFIEAPRSLVIDGWNAEALGLGVGIALAVLVVMVTLSSKQLRSRVRR